MKNNEKRSLGNVLFTAIALFGSYISSTAYISLTYILKGITILFKALWRITDRFRKWLVAHLKKLGRILLISFLRAQESFKKPFE